jgi:Uma2 family endonuclease
MIATSPIHPATPISRPGWPAQGHWRYEDYRRLPDDGIRYEIIEGVLYVANAPSIEHQFSVSEVHFPLKLFVREHQLGQVFTAPLEVHLAERTRPVQPDVLFIRAERLSMLGIQFIDGAPDLVVEVISPSSIRLDRHVKFDAYERAGVAEYWLADPKVRSVEIYVWSNGEYALLGQYAGDEMIESQVLAGLQIRASILFPSADTPLAGGTLTGH